jgi:hypothetical protein
MTKIKRFLIKLAIKIEKLKQCSFFYFFPSLDILRLDLLAVLNLKKPRFEMFARILHAFYRALGNQLSINYEFFCVHKAPLRQFKVFSWAKLARSIQRKHETNIFFQL